MIRSYKFIHLFQSFIPVHFFFFSLWLIEMLCRVLQKRNREQLDPSLMSLVPKFNVSRKRIGAENLQSLSQVRVVQVQIHSYI